MLPHRIRLPVALCCALPMLAACNLTRPPELDVEQQWSDAMRRLAMFGFYPVSEDVQPGDVLLYAPPRTGFTAFVERQFDDALPWPRARD